MKIPTAWLAGVLAVAATGAAAFAHTDTTFTYQGRLDFQGAPYTGAADYRFTLWDAATGGGQVGVADLKDGVPVTAGLFTVALDFGATAPGPGRFLQIEVRTPAWDGQGSEPAFFAFPERTPLTAAPYALQTRGLFVNEAGNRVGIGTTTPNVPLHVVGENPLPHVRVAAAPTAPFGAFLSLDASATPNGNEYLLFATGGSAGEGPGKLVIQSRSNRLNALTIQPNGNVGIGTTNPAERLHVEGNIRMGPSASLSALGGAETLRLVRGNVNADGTINAGAAFGAERMGTGFYRITLAQPIAVGSMTVVAVASGGLGNRNFCTVARRDQTSFDVRVFSDTGQSVDDNIMFMAMGRTE